MSNTSLTKEMELAVQYFNLEFHDLEKITLNAMKSAFIHHNEKISIIYDVIKAKFAEIRREIGIL